VKFPPDILDEKRLMGREQFRVEPRRVLMRPNRFVGYPVSTDDHRGWYGGVSKGGSPSRDQLASANMTASGESVRKVHRDLPATVVLQLLGDQLSREVIVATSWQ
jgi:hypothetical protein